MEKKFHYQAQQKSIYLFEWLFLYGFHLPQDRQPPNESYLMESKERLFLASRKLEVSFGALLSELGRQFWFWDKNLK